MANVYGAPFDRGQQVNRWLRRGETGLLRGRSERVAPVRLARRSGLRRTVSAGPDGGGGLPGAVGMSVGWKGYEQVDYRLGVSFGVSTYNEGATAIATTDVDAVPYVQSSSGAGADSSAGFGGYGPNDGVFEANLFQIGQGNGRGGFITISQFALSDLSASRRWFVGVASGAGAGFISWTGEPSSHTNLIGVGQDSGDSSPQFMVNDGSGSATKSSTGLGTIVADRIYEVDVFCDPFGTSAEITISAYTGTVLTATATHTATANLPAVTMSPVFYANNGASGGATKLILVTFWGEVQPRADEL